MVFLRLLFRNFSSKAENAFTISGDFVNRNPRNLERMRIGYKPDGYHLEKVGKRFWHQLHLWKTGRNVTAAIEHFENGEVIKASTAEWCLQKVLYRGNDTSAYSNLGRVLADRCLKFGITEIQCYVESPRAGGRVDKFLEALRAGGMKLEEPPQYKKPYPWDQERQEKPWDVIG